MPRSSRFAGAVWRKSTYSSQQSECVEVAGNLPGVVAVRDSKDPDAGWHTVRPVAWTAFVRAVKQGKL